MALLDYQVPHYRNLQQVLAHKRAALDGSDTGLGKTYVALHLCQWLDVVPLVIGTRTGRGEWEKASALLGVPIEYVNYEKLRGQRKYDEVRERSVANTAYIEEVPWGKGSFLKWKQSYAMIIFDEVHKCGGATSLNSKMLIAAKRQAQYVLALSATAADDARQMKALGFVLGLHGLGRKTRTTPDYMGFLYRHGVTPGTFGGFDFTADPEKQKKAFLRLHTEIYPYCGARMRKAEIPGFPQTKIGVKLLTDETGKAKELLEEIKEIQETHGDLTASIKERVKLEKLKVPHMIDLAIESGLTSKFVIFVNFTEPLFEIYEGLFGTFGSKNLGYISGAQVGAKGDAERQRFLADFRDDKLAGLVCNSAAAGESASMHGKADRTTFISPMESGRQCQQVLGRVWRAGGGFSNQYFTYFKGTAEEVVANRLEQKNFNISLLNDGELII